MEDDDDDDEGGGEDEEGEEEEGREEEEEEEEEETTVDRTGNSKPRTMFGPPLFHQKRLPVSAPHPTRTWDAVKTQRRTHFANHSPKRTGKFDPIQCKLESNQNGLTEATAAQK